MLAEADLPFFRISLDYPMVHLFGRPWESAGKPVPVGSMPYFVRSFLVTFDFYLEKSVSVNRIKGLSLNCFYARFKSAGSTFAVALYFDLNMDQYARSPRNRVGFRAS